MGIDGNTLFRQYRTIPMTEPMEDPFAYPRSHPCPPRPAVTTTAPTTCTQRENLINFSAVKQASLGGARPQGRKGSTHATSKRPRVVGAPPKVKFSPAVATTIAGAEPLLVLRTTLHSNSDRYKSGLNPGLKPQT